MGDNQTTDLETAELPAESEELLTLSHDELVRRVTMNEAAFAADRDARLTDLHRLTARIAEGSAAQRERKQLVKRLYASGWTQVELADVLDMSQQAVSRIITAAPDDRLVTVESRWWLIGRMFGVAGAVASRLGLAGETARAEAIHRPREKYFTRAVNTLAMDQVMRPVRAELARMPQSRFTLEVSAALADIEERMNPLGAAAIHPTLDDIGVCVGADAAQHLHLSQF